MQTGEPGTPAWAHRPPGRRWPERAVPKHTRLEGQNAEHRVCSDHQEQKAGGRVGSFKCARGVEILVDATERWSRVKQWSKVTTRCNSLSPRNNLMRAQVISHVRLFATPQTVACQAPLSMGFSRQEHWSGMLFPSPEDLLFWSPASQADSLSFELQGSPEKVLQDR